MSHHISEYSVQTKVVHFTCDDAPGTGMEVVLDKQVTWNTAVECPGCNKRIEIVYVPAYYKISDAEGRR